MQPYIFDIDQQAGIILYQQFKVSSNPLLEFFTMSKRTVRADVRPTSKPSDHPDAAIFAAMSLARDLIKLDDKEKAQ